MLQRLSGLADFFIRECQVVLRLQHTRLEFDCRLEFADGLGGITGGQYGAQVLMCIGIVGKQFDGLAESGDRLLIISGLHVYQA